MSDADPHRAASLPRKLFTAEHEQFRAAFRRFVEREIAPHHGEWETAGCVPRPIWEKAGALGFLGMDVPEEYGGGGVEDWRFNLIVIEEMARAGAHGPGFVLHNDVTLPYLLAYANEEQKTRWLPAMVAGECITAIAMTEPGTGSDLAAVQARARRENGHYILNGQKTFITNGILSDHIIVVARTGEGGGHGDISLLVAERGMTGFRRGRNLAKIGMAAQDTAELFFEDVRIPAANLLGEEGAGFGYLMRQLPQERLSIAAAAVASGMAALEETLAYVKGRRAFGQPIGRFQHSRFTLAELHSELNIAQVFVDRCAELHLRGELTAEGAAIAKYWTTDVLNCVVDRCLQLHGGYGYMREYSIARAYLDARVQSIYGGTNEIMKEIIGRALGLA